MHKRRSNWEETLKKEGVKKWLNDYDYKFKKMFGELKLFELRTANKVLRGHCSMN